MIRRFCIALVAMVATSSFSLGQSLGEGNGGANGSFDFQSMELFQPPIEGIVTPLDDNSAFCMLARQLRWIPCRLSRQMTMVAHSLR